MKQSILLLLTFLFAAQIFAQITVERADYTLSTNATNTVEGWRLNLADLTLPEEGADVTWDYSGLSITNPTSYTKTPVSEPLFPDANLLEIQSGLALGVAPQDIMFYEELADDGYKVLGRTTPFFTIPAQPLTGGPNDTISFLGTVSVYEEPNYYIKFPLAYEDFWDSEINIEGNYLMTVAAFGLDNTPASSNYNYVETNSVAGYGTLILPHPDGNGTVSMEALLVKSTTVRTDSFFLAGQPAPQLMLDVLGSTQGLTETYTDYAFYAKGLNRTAIRMREEDGQIVSSSIADDIKNIVSSTRLVAENLLETKVFPNPTSGDFQINFEKPDANQWILNLYNPLGQMVKQQTFEDPAGEVSTRISLPSTVAAGIHHLVLRNAQNIVMASERVIID